MRVFMIVANDSNVGKVRHQLGLLQRVGAALIEVPDAHAAHVVGAVVEALAGTTGYEKGKGLDAGGTRVHAEPAKEGSSPLPAKRTKSGPQERVRAGNGHGAHGVHAARLYHAWVSEGPGIDHCAKCGMVREHLEKGVLAFMDRMGRIVERAPFGEATPACDALLVNKRLVRSGASS